MDVAEIAREMVRSLQGEIRRKKLRMIQQFPAKPVWLWADSGDLVQIILNLLSNALKFTPVKGVIRLGITPEKRHLVIEISDTGVGIPPEELPKIFDEFYHVDHPETGAGSGSGLGLAIVKRVVESYRGEINVSSRVGRGTSFRVRLPVRPEEEILEEFFGETWTQARREGQYLGLILLQVRRGSSGAAEKSTAKLLSTLEQALKDCLRKEDRVFHLPGHQLLTVLVKVNRDGFSVLTQRLERAVRDAAGKGAGSRRASLWKLVTLLVPRRGSPARFLDLAQRRLDRAWKSSDRGAGEG